MIRFEIYETCTTNYTNYVEIPDDVVKDFLNDCRQRSLSREETEEELEEYLNDIKWEYISDRELTNEECDDSELDYETFDIAVDEAMEYYEEPSKKLIGDFGND